MRLAGAAAPGPPLHSGMLAVIGQMPLAWRHAARASRTCRPNTANRHAGKTGGTEGTRWQPCSEMRKKCLSSCRRAADLCVAMQLLQLVKQGGLEESFLYKKSRFTKLLTTYPLYAVVHASLGLLGTREYATRLLRSPELCKATA